MKTFLHDPLPSRILFGEGQSKKAVAELARLDARSAFILTSSSQSDAASAIAASLGERYAGTYLSTAQHVLQQSVDIVLEMTRQLEADLLIAVGGGSPIGLAKAIALESRLPILAIPTTYSGSEMTHIWGILQDGRKITGRDPIVKPIIVIYDPKLLTTLPPLVSLTSGINAMAHAVEALYADRATPVTALLAEEAVRCLAQSLPKVVAEPENLDGRAQSLYGAWLAAAVLDQVDMGLHHKLCHTLGGSFKMPHAQTHTVILPYAIAYNYSYASEAMDTLARALACDRSDVAGAVYDLSQKNGGPVSLEALGFEPRHIDEAAKIAVQKPYANPRPITLDGVRRLLVDAFAGARPLPLV